MDVTNITNELVYIGREIAFPKALLLGFAADEECPAAISFQVTYSEIKKRYVLSQAHISAPDSDGEITGQLIRAIPFQEILFRGLSQLKYFDLNTQALSLDTALSYTPVDREEMIRRGPDSATLDNVALIYRIAEVLNANQGKHLESILQIPYATAANWISRARKDLAFQRIEDGNQRFPGLKRAPSAALQGIAQTIKRSGK